MTTPRLRPLLVVAVIIALGACDGAPDSPLATPTSSSAVDSSAVDSDDGDASVVVNIARSRFETTELRIEPGTTVVFVNTDAFDHTVTSRDDAPVAFDSGELGEGERFEITFDEPGEYAYFCQIHPTMRATVVVG